MDTASPLSVLAPIWPLPWFVRLSEISQARTQAARGLNGRNWLMEATNPIYPISSAAQMQQNSPFAGNKY